MSKILGSLIIVVIKLSITKNGNVINLQQIEYLYEYLRHQHMRVNTI